MTAMLRVSERTRDRVMQVAAEEFGGATAEETLIRLLDEHWEARAIAAMDHFRATDPTGWSDYLAEADRWDGAQASAGDTWQASGGGARQGSTGGARQASVDDTRQASIGDEWRASADDARQAPISDEWQASVGNARQASIDDARDEHGPA